MDEEEMDSNEYQEEQEKKPKKPEEKESWFKTKISLLFLAAGVAGIIVPFPWWGTILLWLAWGLTMVLAIWEEWAPMDFNVGFVEEGTIRAVGRGKEIYKFFLRHAGSHLASEEEVQGDGPALRKWDVIEDTFPIKKSIWRELFGGLVWIGPYPFQRAIDFPFEWFNLHSDGKLHYHKEKIKAVLVKWEIYGIPILNTENKDHMPIDIVFTIPMRIRNPYEALFEVRRWLPMVMGLILPPLRRFIAGHNYHELLSMKPSDSGEQLSPGVGDLRDELWGKILKALEEKESSLTTVKKISESRIRVYGIELDWERAGFFGLDPNKSYRAMTTLVWEAEQKGKATEIAGAAKGAAIAAEIANIGISVLGIAKQLAGVDRNTSEDEFTEVQRQSIAEKFNMAYDKFLNIEALQAMKDTDKMIISRGAKSLGSEIAGTGEELTKREAVRAFVGKELYGQQEQNNKDKEE